MEVTWVATTPCFKRRLTFLSIVTYSSDHQWASAPVKSIQSTLHSAPDFWNVVSLAVLFGSNGNSYTISMRLGMCIYTYSSQYRDTDQAKEIKKFGTVCQGNLSAYYRFTSCAVDRD